MVLNSTTIPGLSLLFQRSNIKTVKNALTNSTYLCGDRGWKYRGTCSAYRTGCIFVLLRYHDIPAITGNAHFNLSLTSDNVSRADGKAYSKSKANLSTHHYALINNQFLLLYQQWCLFRITDTINPHQLRLAAAPSQRPTGNICRDEEARMAPVCETTYLPEYKVFSDDGLN